MLKGQIFKTDAALPNFIQENCCDCMYHNNVQVSTLSVMSYRFLEYGEYKGNMYGTSVESVREVLNSGKTCVIDIEPNVSTMYNLKEGGLWGVPERPM